MLCALLSSCGGGSGSGTLRNTGEQITDPVIPLVGPTGKYSMTPQEANTALGLNPPPLLPPTLLDGENHWLRLDVPFDVMADTVIDPDPFLAPFSYLNGNITITDLQGNHIRCTVLIGGKDRDGKDRTKDAGYPKDLTASGTDLNDSKGSIVFIADDGDDDFSTPAAFGGTFTDTDLRPETTDITEVRLTVTAFNNRRIDGFYKVTVGTGASGGDQLPPSILAVFRDTPSPAAPDDTTQADYRSSFIVRFSEPMVPTTVGHSSRFDGSPFDGNIPFLPIPPNPPARPLPDTHITAQLNTGRSPLYIPCDVTPLNSNNLAMYVVKPLLPLPPSATLRLTVVDANSNANPNTGAPKGPIDLSGNFHLPGADAQFDYLIGPGRPIVNAPVAPEAIVWVPNSKRGLGVIDLNGRGFTTNTPGANAGDYTKAALVTKPLGLNFLPSLDLQLGIALRAHPAGAAHNQFLYPVGLGSYTYGPTDPNTPNWEDSADSGNPGTPVPGLNEMSSGYQTMVRNAAGEVILTGEEFGTVGTVTDCILGEFLDAAIFDTQSIFNTSTGHASFYWGRALDTNSINEAPMPNPPPTRFWVGLSPIDVLLDQSSPSGPARVITGDEVWAGDHSLDQVLLGAPPLTGLVRKSWQWVLPNPDSPLLPDVGPPHYDMLPAGATFPNKHWGRSLGPSPQSATLFVRHSVRQQVGNFLYVTDAENRQLHAINSNTFDIIESIDLPDPTGLGLDADSRYLFVSNASDDSVSVIGANPVFSDFHQEVARIDVGRFPNPVAAQPDGEDVFIGNIGDNSISILSLNDLTIRKTIDTLVQNPVDIVLAPRQNGFGFLTSVYFGYIANFGGNNVLVFESGPDGPQGIGCDDILGSLPTEDDAGITIVEPRGMCYSPYPNDQDLLAGGVFIAHRDTAGKALVSHIQFTHQVIPGPLPCQQPPGLFTIPPGFNDRDWTITGQWGTSDANRLIGRKPTSVVLADFRRDLIETRPAQSPNNADRGVAPYGATNSRHPLRFLPPTDPRTPYAPTYEPDRMYVSFEDTDVVQVLSPTQIGVSLGTCEGAGAGISIKKLVTFFQQ